MSGYTIYDNDFIDVQTGLMLGGVSCHSYRCDLGCILLKMAAISLLTGATQPHQVQPVCELHHRH